MEQRVRLEQFLSSDLNPEQEQAVLPHKGILLVRAGAGSGKTRVITARIAHLIHNYNVDPSQIIALTFTNKAAQEMRQRVQQFLGSSITLPFVGTFHSYALRFLKLHAHLLPFAHFSLLDDADQHKLAREVIGQTASAKKINSYQLLSTISQVKNDINYVKSGNLSLLNPFIRDLFTLYESKKNSAHCFDFDDLLVWCVKLLLSSQDVKTSIHQTLKHILVDEYQDTNHIQHMLLKLLSLEKNICQLDSLCVVGDEDQSIYSWRGAVVSNILNFRDDFKHTQAITIAQNYRSVQPILAAANSVIAHNKLRTPKQLTTNRTANNRIQILECSSSKQEAEVVSFFLKQLASKKVLKQCAILYRSHFQSRSIEEALIRHAIPYKIIGGIQFYNRQEIKDIIAYLRLIVNPYDRVALARAINTPHRGLGPKFQELFLEFWSYQPFATFMHIAQQLLDESRVTGIKAQSLITFLNIFENLHNTSKTSIAVEEILKKTNYMRYLDHLEENAEDAQARKDNIKEFINSILYIEQTTDTVLEQFLHDISLLQDQILDKSEHNDCVKLMTFHAAKGLEFDNILLIGCEEGILPNSRSFEQPESLEEERRLLYVGITRARERLLITHTRYRFTYGQATDQRPSRFLPELPYDYVTHFDVKFWHEPEIKLHFAHWLNKQQSPSHSSQSLITSTNSSTPDHQLQPAKRWQQYKSVQHNSFGIGVIQRIENKHSKTYLTIRFSCGLKKIEASFIKPL